MGRKMPSSWNESVYDGRIDNISYFNSEDNESYNDDTYSKRPIYINNPEDMLKPWIGNPLFFHIVITHSAAFIFGLIGNVVVIVVMIGDRKARNSTNLFLVSLAAADLLLLVVCAPLETLHYFVVQWDESGAVCKMAVYAELLSAIASVLNLAAVTLERFIVIVFPMKSRSVCTIKNCRRAIIFVWCIALILTTPVLATKKTFPVVVSNNITNLTLYYCNEAKQSGSFAIYQFVVLFGAPGMLMILCYTYVIRELWRSTRNMQMLTNSVSVKKARSLNGPTDDDIKTTQVNYGESQHKITQNRNSKRNNKGEDARQARKQVIKMLILVIILFLICWGPRIILEVIIKHNLHSFTQVVYTMRVTFYLLPYIHACMNPFIYSFMSKNFRRALQRQLEKMGCKKRTRSGGSSRTAHGSSTRTSKSHRSTPTMRRSWRELKLIPGHGRPSTSSCTTNCITDLTRQTDIDPGLLPLHPATSSV